MSCKFGNFARGLKIKRVFGRKEKILLKIKHKLILR